MDAIARDLDWLVDSLHAIDRVFFDDSLGLSIRWGRFRRAKSGFTFGVYRSGVIEINPVLALDWVPSCVPLSTIFHEALHHRFGDEHGELFRLAELRFPHHAESESWCAANVDRLMAATRPKGLR